eukprot:TRINITY_DN46935_c0_g1_i1.p1 TRINITY_DN46935_c0_g1~~TRINITY_DN46935_c0_g1_i1.p1  ORF type:complete len:365 (-),score=72.26 TRINITY_DN46935_c0_g1_i1:116-1210(-)
MLAILCLVLSFAWPAAGIVRESSWPATGLSVDDLRNITTIECLERKIQDKNAVCNESDYAKDEGTAPMHVSISYHMRGKGQGDAAAHKESERHQEQREVVVKIKRDSSAKPEPEAPVVSLYNYPNYREPACRSGGMIFCDPMFKFTSKERENISKELVLQAKEHLVVCNDLIREPIDQRHLAPFYLGVALGGLNGHDADEATLKQYAQLILTEWNMGVAKTQVTRCPNEALLLVLPKEKRAVLVSKGCDYLCAEHSGRVVPEEVERSLRHGESVATAVLAGVRRAYSSIENTVPEGSPMPSPRGEAASSGSSTEGSSKNGDNWENTSSVFLQRVLFAFALGALALSLLVGCAVMTMAPGLAKRR